MKLAKEEDYWSAGIRETVKKRLEKDKDDVRLDWIVEDLMIKNTGGTVISIDHQSLHCRYHELYFLTDQEIAIHSHQMKAFCIPLTLQAFSCIEQF